jgi:hypothetical protein
VSKPPDLPQIYAYLEAEVKEVASASLATDPLHSILARACLAKTFEFNQFLAGHASEHQSFFFTATLRGICEDIIALKYFKDCVDPADTQTILQAWIHLQYLEGVDAQTQFFNANRPHQPVLKNGNVGSRMEETINRIRAYRKKFNWRRTPPTTQQMAEASGLGPLYDYLYDATSRVVHFSPSVLLRMGWGPENKPDATYHFSSENFFRYYSQFNEFYGVYLFVLFFDIMKDQLGLSEKFSNAVEDLRSYLNDCWRWPEMVTFAEMNLPEPSPILYALGRLMHDQQNESGESDA